MCILAHKEIQKSLLSTNFKFNKERDLEIMKSVIAGRLPRRKQVERNNSAINMKALFSVKIFIMH